MNRFFNHPDYFVDSKARFRIYIFTLILMATNTFMPICHAEAYSGSYGSGSYGDSNLSQAKARWYRYYANGQPSLSTTITDQHLKYGYEVLDRNMQVIKRVGPYSTANYERQKARQEALAAQHNADMNLRRAYGSAAQATTKRDQMLNEMESRKTYLKTQLIELQVTLNKNIAQAANLERQRKPIPSYLQKNLVESRKNVATAEQNIQAITERQQQTRQQYDQVIQRLSRIQ